MTIHVSLSGGMDSTALLTMASSTPGQEARAVAFDYGQRHRRELTSAQAVAQRLGVPFQVRNVRGLLRGSALLGEGDVPEGHYAAESMAATVVQGRNMLFAASLVATAAPGDQVWLAVHGGDHHIYPDCRPSFWLPFASAVSAAYGVEVRTPFIAQSKAEVIGLVPDAPYDLSWSCYNGGDLHCGRCGTCVERAEAFALAKRHDPTRYADPAYWKEAVG